MPGPIGLQYNPQCPLHLVYLTLTCNQVKSPTLEASDSATGEESATEDWKDMRFPKDRGIAGHVASTGEVRVGCTGRRQQKRVSTTSRNHGGHSHRKVDHMA